MSAVTVDIRMLKKGTKWCATAHVSSPSLRGPIDLYACQDIRDSMKMLQKAFDTVNMPKEYVSKASAAARKRVRREILGLTYNLIAQLSSDLKTGSTKIQKSLEACDHACDLVFRSRGGDMRAKKSIEAIFLRAKGGDRDAERSARLILESADLLDDGRASFRVTAVADPANEHRPFERKVLALPMPRVPLIMPMSTTGAEQPTANYYPGTTVVNSPKLDVSKKQIAYELDHLEEFFAYPMDNKNSDRNGYNIFNVIKPAVAMY